MIGAASGFVETADLSTALRCGRDDKDTTNQRLTKLEIELGKLRFKFREPLSG